MLTIEVFAQDAPVHHVREKILRRVFMQTTASRDKVHRCGESSLRPGMIERVILSHHNHTHEAGYNWTLLFPIESRAVHIEIFKMSGNFETDRPMWEELITSFRFVNTQTQPSESPARPGVAESDASLIHVMSDEPTPHVILPAMARKAWKGVPEPTHEAFHPASALDPSTHFGRALAIEGAFELLPLSRDHVLVFAGALMTACKSNMLEGRVTLASMSELTGDEDERIKAALNGRYHDSLAPTGDRWHIRDTNLIVCDALDLQGAAELDRNQSPVRAGEYEIFSAELLDDENVPLNLVELRHCA